MLKHLGSSLAASVAILGFTAIGGIVSARCLLPAGKGELTAIILWPTFFSTIGGLGLAEAVTYYIATRRERSRQVLSTALGLTLVSSVVLVLVGWVLLPKILAPHGEHTVRAARMFLLYVPVSAGATIIMAAMQGNLRLGVYNLLRTMVHILTVAGMLLLVMIGQASVWTLALAVLAANVLTLVVAGTLAFRSGWLGLPESTTTARCLLRFGLQSHVGTLASVVNLRLDQMVMSALMSAPVLGLYVIAVTIAGVANIGPVAIGAVAFPRISSEHDVTARLRRWGQLLRLSVVLQLMVGAALWWAAPLIVRVCFGPAFSASTAAARILIVASLPLGINIMLASGFRAFNRPLTPSAAETISLGATAAGLWFLLVPYGAVGAAWASLLAYSMTCGFLLTQVWIQLRCSPFALLVPHRDDWVKGRALFVQVWSNRLADV